MSIALIIPARYGSTRFPGKPLAEIGGKSMLSHVVEVARKAAKGHDDIRIAVATEDERIQRHCEVDIDVTCIMTSDNCRTGSDRINEAAQALSPAPGFVINIQGDVPFTPPSVVKAMIDAFKAHPEAEVMSPCHQLTWDELDTLRERKKQTPFSGTTVTFDKSKKALWFSKNIIPSIRKEDEMRKTDTHSPVWRHIGIYGYRTDILEKFVQMPSGHYETLEGLEQLRFLENGISVQMVPVEVDAGIIHSGIDSPEDLAHAENILAQQAG